MSALADLRYPRRFAEWTLAHGNILGALVCASVAMAFSTAAAYRLAATVHPEDLVFGPTRIDVVATLISGIGVERTAVLVYMLQRSFDALLIASAVTPFFLWILGSSAMHAAARLRGVRGHAYLPMLVLFAYATVVYQVPTSAAGLLLGAFGSGPGPQVASIVSVVTLVWFGFVAFRGIELHYEVSADRALGIFVIGATVFYLVPLVLIVAALVAIVLAASLLQYF